jgi:hypothetical protein
MDSRNEQSPMKKTPPEVLTLKLTIARQQLEISDLRRQLSMSNTFLAEHQMHFNRSIIEGLEKQIAAIAANKVTKNA